MKIKQLIPSTLCGWVIYVYSIIAFLGIFGGLLLPKIYTFKTWPDSVDGVTVYLYFYGLAFLVIWRIWRNYQKGTLDVPFKEMLYGLFVITVFNSILCLGAHLMIQNILHLTTRYEGEIVVKVLGKNDEYIKGGKPPCEGGIELERLGVICYEHKLIWHYAEQGQYAKLIGEISDAGVVIEDVHLFKYKNQD